MKPTKKNSKVKQYLTAITIILLIISIIVIFLVKPQDIILWGILPFGIASVIIFILNFIKAIKQKSIMNEIFFKIAGITVFLTILALPSTILPILGLDLLTKIPESRYVVLIFAILGSLNLIYSLVKE